MGLETCVTLKDPEIKKVSWSIGEVADLFGVSPSAIRFLDAEFHITNERNRRGNRIFRQSTLDRMLDILALRERGFHLKAIHRELKRKSF